MGIYIPGMCEIPLYITTTTTLTPSKKTKEIRDPTAECGLNEIEDPTAECGQIKLCLRQGKRRGGGVASDEQ